MFFIDSFGPNGHILPPDVFKALRSGSILFGDNEKVEGLAPLDLSLRLMPYPEAYKRQQADGIHCGDWVLFNAFMVWATGSNDFLKIFHAGVSAKTLVRAANNLRAFLLSVCPSVADGSFVFRRGAGAADADVSASYYSYN